MGTAGGTILSIIPNVFSADLIKTILLASVGAIVSFTVSYVLKCIFKKFKRKD
jgi:hypothetical protein